jgi:hypothetical protein
MSSTIPKEKELQNECPKHKIYLINSKINVLKLLNECPKL